MRIAGGNFGLVKNVNINEISNGKVSNHFQDGKMLYSSNRMTVVESVLSEKYEHLTSITIPDLI